MTSLAIALLTGCATAVANQGAPAPDASSQHPGSSPADASTSDSSGFGSGSGSGPSGNCTQPMTGVLASWSFSGQPGSQSSTASSMSAPGVSAQAVQRSSGISSASGAGSMNASDWTMSGQPDQTRYFSLSIQPPAGCSLDITSAHVDAKASASGPSHATVSANVDGFVQGATISTSSASTAQLSVSQATGTVEVRVYGYSATSSAGTLRLQNTLTISGSLH